MHALGGRLPWLLPSTVSKEPPSLGKGEFHVYKRLQSTPTQEEMKISEILHKSTVYS